tara:strand:- start:334 stop:456 length:123 start_codon:yes stop_codon:yes gene_type:complete
MDYEELELKIMELLENDSDKIHKIMDLIEEFINNIEDWRI